jgi:hypothetical protein
MPPRQSHLPQDRSAIIPPRIQQEMARHMEQTLPANLQYYQKSGDYVPPNVQKQMAQHMEQTMPNHLKQYINPYMQQQVVPQHLAQPGGQTAFNPVQTPQTYTANQGPSHAFDTQPTQGFQPQQVIQPLTPQPTAEPQVISPPQEPYAFITDPQNIASSAPNPLSLKGKSMRKRIAIVGGGLVVLLIVLNILKGLLAGSFPLQPFVAVVQDQQELMHLTSTSAQAQPGQSTLPPAYLNFITTTQLSVTSSQSQLLTYLVDNKQKVNPKEFDLKVSTSIDAQLANAVTSNTYASTFQQIMNSQLVTYASDLNQAYKQSSGVKGHALLRSDYKQAVLLIKQLKQASDTDTSS